MSEGNMSEPIPLKSSAGQELWKDCMQKRHGMIKLFVPDYTPLLSGPASLALLVNERGIAYHLIRANMGLERDHWKEHETSENNVITTDEFIALKQINEFFESDWFNVKEKGMKLLGLNGIMWNIELKTDLYYGKNETLDDDQREELESVLRRLPFKRKVLDGPEAFESIVCEKMNSVDSTCPRSMIVNYNPSALGLPNRDESSYFSLIAAHHKGKVLIMDAGTDGPVWVDSKDLFIAMCMIHKTVKKDDDEDDKPDLPMGLIVV